MGVAGCPAGRVCVSLTLASRPETTGNPGLLFGGCISGVIAGHTCQAFAEHGLLTPRKILKAGYGTIWSIPSCVRVAMCATTAASRPFRSCTTANGY